MTKLLFFLLLILSFNAFSQAETYILEGSSARSFTSTITHENPGDFGIDLEYQRRLTDDNYQAPVLNSTPGDMFRNSIAGLFNQSVQYSRREQERMAQQMRTAITYDRLARLAPEIQRRLNEHIRSAQAYREHVHRQAARTIDIMESVNRIKRSKYRKTKERALFNATRIKLDYTTFEGRLKDKFNAVRAKYWSVKEEHFVSEKSYEFLDMGATSYFDALDKYTNNDESGAERSLELSNTFLDIALGSTPFVGMFKDAYEAYSGKSLLTDEALTQTERALSVVGFGVGLMTGGTLSGAVKLLPKLIPYAKNIVSSGVSILKSARKLGLKTSEGIKDFADLSKRILENDIGAVGNLSKVIKGKMTRYSPIKKGPLSDIPIDSGNTVADTFRSSSYFETVLDEPLKVYRVYGGEGGELGSYWSRVKPTGPGQATFDAALLPSFRNSAQKVAEITIPAGTKIFEGVASSQTIRSAGANIKIGELLGNGSQIYINQMIDKDTWKFISRGFFE